MNHGQREHGDPFAAPDTPTLQTVLDRLGDLTDITPARRDDLMSAVRSVCRMAGHDPRDIVAGPVRIRNLLAQCKPARHGVGPGRWSNIRSLVSRALALVGISVTAGKMLAPISDDWSRLYGQLPSKNMKCCLSRLLRHLSLRGVSPATVTLEDIELCEADNLRSVLRDPMKANQKMRLSWNRARQTVPGWPQVAVEIIDRRNGYVVPEEELTTSYRHDVERFLAWSGQTIGFDDEAAPLRPVRPTTIKNKRQSLRTMVSAAIRNGVPADSLRSLADLVEPDTVRAALRFLAERYGSPQSATLQNHMAQLVIVARDWVKVPGDQFEILRKFAGRVAPDRRGGMTELNRSILREFEDPKLVERLLLLPERLFEEACREAPGSWTRGQKQARAVALAILLAAPIRVLNLVSTRIDRNLLRVRDGKSHRYELLFAPEEVKNSVELSMPLPPWVASLIDRYRSDGRRALGQGANAWLFPGMTDRHMSTQAMTTRIGQITERRLGVRLTAHKFRHVAGAIFLRDNPGQYETVRRLLGHKNLATTLNFYAGMEQAAATRHYSTTIEARRQVLLQSPSP